MSKTMAREAVGGSHLGRIRVIALHTFTQLMRMKVFYFLGLFAVVMLAVNLLNLPQYLDPESTGESVLVSIKTCSFGTMHLFSVVLAVVATGLLLPRDVEDRTLYTILAKPVPRLDYLAGKLCGVWLLILVSLAVMHALMVGVLELRVSMLMGHFAELEGKGYPLAELAGMRADVQAQAPDASLHFAVVAVFLRAAIMASIALMVSTFSTSTLFTTVTGFMVYFIGHFQADMREVFLQPAVGSDGGGLVRAGAWLLTVVFPDFQLFNVIDGVVDGVVLPVAVLGRLALVGLAYAVFHLAASWYVFSGKEF